MFVRGGWGGGGWVKFHPALFPPGRGGGGGRVQYTASCASQALQPVLVLPGWGGDGEGWLPRQCDPTPFPSPARSSPGCCGQYTIAS